MTEDEAQTMVQEAKRHLKQATVTTSDPVSLRQLKEYLAATGDWNPYYHDPEVAEAGPFGAIIGPPLFYDAPLRQVVPEHELLEDGQYAFLAAPGIEGRSLAAGDDAEFLEPVRIGDVLTIRTWVDDVWTKPGKSGPLVFQVLASEVTNQKGEIVARRRRTNIFR